MLIHPKHKGPGTIWKRIMSPQLCGGDAVPAMETYHLELVRTGGNLIMAMRILRRSGVSLGVAVRAVETLSIGFEVDVEIPSPDAALECQLMEIGIAARRL